MKWKQRNQNPETDEQQEINVFLCARRDERGARFQLRDVERLRALWQTLIEQDQSEQENETSHCQVDRDLPCGGNPVAASPDPNEQKCRDQRELVERIKEKEIERSKRADCSGRNQQQAGVKRVFVAIDFAGEPDRG